MGFVLTNFLLLACNFIKKETLVQVFSCEFYEIFQNIFCYRTSLVAASRFPWRLLFLLHFKPVTASCKLQVRENQRQNYSEIFCEKDVLETLAKLTGKYWLRN